MYFIKNLISCVIKMEAQNEFKTTQQKYNDQISCLGRCDIPLGLEDGRFPDQLVTASSFYNYYCAPRNARLHQRRVGRLGGAWCARRSDRNQWIQFDFGGRTRVTRVCTQGRQNSDQWVTSYYVTYSRDGQHFTPYREGRGTKVNYIRQNRLNYVLKPSLHYYISTSISITVVRTPTTQAKVSLLLCSSLEPLISLDLVGTKLYCFRARVHCYYCLHIIFSANPVRRFEELPDEPSK